MTASITTKSIKEISGQYCLPVLKEYGFRRRSPHLFRSSEDLFHCIHFQASQWGSKNAGSFTINLAITSEALYKYWTGKSLPKNPATALWPIQERIGHLLSEDKDMWWDVDTLTDIVSLGKDIANCLKEYALPFFSAHTTTDDIFKDLSSGKTPPGVFEAQIPLLHAILLVDRGKHSEAEKLIQNARKKHLNKPFESTVCTIADRLGINY